MGKLEAQDGYRPDQQVVSAVEGYARQTEHGFGHVLRWVRVLVAFGVVEDMTAAEARGYADRGSGWERWGPVADELAELEGAEEGGASGNQGEENQGEEPPAEEPVEEPVEEPSAVAPADPVFAAGAAVTLSIAEGHVDGALVGTVSATDANGDVLTYSLSGADAALFALNASTGEISVVPGVSLDFESPLDADGDNAYEVTVGVSDGYDADGNPETTPTVDATVAVTIEGHRRGRRCAGVLRCGGGVLHRGGPC